jgi:pyruvate ferredoxin oxidoreductase alpha subunit
VVERYHMDDAECVLVMVGSFATKAKAAVRALRGEGRRVGLLRLRLVRPWPAEAIRRELAGRRAVAVIDQNLSPGLGGILFQEVAAAVGPSPDRPGVLRSFVGGLGGKDIGPGEFRHVADALEESRPGEPAEPELLYTEADWSQVHPLLVIAQAPERHPGEETTP